MSLGSADGGAMVTEGDREGVMDGGALDRGFGAGDCEYEGGIEAS